MSSRGNGPSTFHRDVNGLRCDQSILRPGLTSGLVSGVFEGSLTRNNHPNFVSGSLRRMCQDWDVDREVGVTRGSSSTLDRRSRFLFRCHLLASGSGFQTGQRTEVEMFRVRTPVEGRMTTEVEEATRVGLLEFREVTVN